MSRDQAHNPDPLPLGTGAMERLVRELTRLPGIGRRSAQRMAFHLLKAPADDALALAAAIENLKRNARHCSACFNLTDADPCPVCSDPRRDHALLLVVEQPADVATFEALGVHRGLYHVLMGRLSPMDDVGPGELNIQPLLDRVDHSQQDPDGTPIGEVILGTNPTLEGDGTALYLAEQLARRNVKVTRLARGMPTGSNLQSVSKAVLADALTGRAGLG